jgi:quercetin dioxygenase-like cupin family protein
MCLLLLNSIVAATVVDLDGVSPKTNNNIEVINLANTQDASSYIIFVRKDVRMHHHKSHTELLHVIEGSANFVLDGENRIIEAGDFIQIEPGQNHGVSSVISDAPLKVLSIQTPQFFGKDRHFVDQ